MTVVTQYDEVLVLARRFGFTVLVNPFPEWGASHTHANLPKGTKTLPIAEWEQEYADLKTQRDSDYTKLKDTRAEVAELQKIRRCVDIALRADQPEQTQSRTKRHEQER